MADNSKFIKESSRRYGLDDFSLHYPGKKKDSAIAALLFVIALAALIIIVLAETVVFTSTYATEEYSLIVFATLLPSYVLVIVFAVFVGIGLFSKRHYINSGEGLHYIYADAKEFKVVENFSGSSVAIQEENTVQQNVQEVDEHGNPIYYAEEVFDDEEDIFVNEVNSTVIAKERAKSYEEIIRSIDGVLEKYGLKGDVGRALVSSMAFSPMIYARDIGEYIPTIFKALGNPNYVIHYSSNNTISNERTLFNSFEYAKAHSDSPVFVYIDGIPAKEFLTYMRSLYTYIDNPNDDYYLSCNGVTCYIPHNVYFLVNITKDSYFYDIARRYLRYISVMKCSVTEVDPSDEAKPYLLSLNDIKNSKRLAMEENALSEQSYKKLDNLLNILREANGYILQNKIQRKIEEYSAILLSIGENEDSVLDDCLANNIIIAAIITTEPQKLESEFHITRLIESEFGADKLKKSKAIIKDYVSIFGAGGGKK